MKENSGEDQDQLRIALNWHLQKEDQESEFDQLFIRNVVKWNFLYFHKLM